MLCVDRTIPVFGATEGEDIQVISRLPATYKECSYLIKAAIASDEWVELGKLSQTVETQNRPAAVYKTWESRVVINDKIYRVVVHSSAHDKRQQKRIDKELQKEHSELSETVKKITSQEFFCQADAEQAAWEIQNLKCVFYAPTTHIVEIPQYRRGRPKMDTVPMTSSERIKINTELNRTSTF